jgi:signal transduction histidine kinase
VFVIFNLFGLAMFVTVGAWVLGALGWAHVSQAQLPWVLPAGGVSFAAGLALLMFAGLNLRRVSRPLDDLLEASNKVAAGDYSARVEEKGPPEVRSMAQAFNAMARRLESHDQQRRAMLADVTHELRTPLTVIQGNLEGVLDGVYPSDEAHLKSILEEVHVLSRLTADLRMLALAETGDLDLRTEQVDLALLIQETAVAFRAQADELDVRIELSLKSGGSMVDIDPERMRQVLANLISNALRYSPPESVLRIGLSELGEGEHKQVMVSVADQGPGIAPADLPHLFDRYYKSADSRGMGLGLSIAKFIVEAHGGEITASSSAGKGTTISFSLPR